MVQKTQASRRYAAALLASITQTKSVSLDEALGQLAVFDDAVSASFDMRNALMNPAISRAERDKALDAMVGLLKLSPTIRDFIRLLIEKGRIHELSEINATFRDLADDQRGRRRALVESAAELNPEAQERLRRALERTTGRTIELEVKVDPSLIGGVRTRIGSTVYDGTVRAELDRLRSTLSGSE